MGVFENAAALDQNAAARAFAGRDGDGGAGREAERAWACDDQRCNRVSDGDGYSGAVE